MSHVFFVNTAAFAARSMHPPCAACARATGVLEHECIGRTVARRIADDRVQLDHAASGGSSESEHRPPRLGLTGEPAPHHQTVLQPERVGPRIDECDQDRGPGGGLRVPDVRSRTSPAGSTPRAEPRTTRRPRRTRTGCRSGCRRARPPGWGRRSRSVTWSVSRTRTARGCGWRVDRIAATCRGEHERQSPQRASHVRQGIRADVGCRRWPRSNPHRDPHPRRA